LKKIKGYVGEKIFKPLYIIIGCEKISITKEGDLFKIEDKLFETVWSVSLFVHSFIHEKYLCSIMYEPFEIPVYITIGTQLIYEDYLSLSSDDELGIDLEMCFDEEYFNDIDPKIVEGLELLGEIYEYK
jgi:hypothetical protein